MLPETLNLLLKATRGADNGASRKDLLALRSALHSQVVFGGRSCVAFQPVCIALCKVGALEGVLFNVFCICFDNLWEILDLNQ